MTVCATVIVDTWHKVDGYGVVGYVVVGAAVIVGVELVRTVVVPSCAVVGSAGDRDVEAFTSISEEFREDANKL